MASQVDNTSPSVFLFKNILKFFGKVITNKIFIVILLVSIIGALIYFIYNKKYIEHITEPEVEPEQTELPKKIIINHPKKEEQNDVVDYSNEQGTLLNNDKSYTEELNDIVGMLDNDKIDTIQAFEKSQEIEPENIGQHNLTNSEIMEINKKLEQY